MKYTIEIDDRSSLKKSLIQVLKDLAKKQKGIAVHKLTKEEIEAREDRNLLRMMEESRESGLADKNEVLKKLGIE